MSPDTSVKRVLIYRLGSLGDTVVALPCFHLIARAYPNADRRLLTNFHVHAKAPAAAAVLGNSGLVHGYMRYTMAALAAVDAVVVFGEATPLELILATRPDVIVKGGDYGVDTIIGAKEVQSWGGQVKIVPLVKGISTTQLIEKGAGK